MLPTVNELAQALFYKRSSCTEFDSDVDANLRFGISVALYNISIMQLLDAESLTQKA